MQCEFCSGMPRQKSRRDWLLGKVCPGSTPIVLRKRRLMRFAVDREQIFVPGIRPPHPIVEQHPRRVQCLGFEKVGFQGCEDRYLIHRHQPRHTLGLFLPNWDIKYSFGGTIYHVKRSFQKLRDTLSCQRFSDSRSTTLMIFDIRINYCYKITWKNLL